MHSTARMLLIRTGQYALALLLAVYSAFPIYYMIICSFRKPAVFYTSRSLLPTSFTLEYYRTLIQRTDFLLQFWNSIIVATATVVVTLVVSIMVAYAVSRFKVRGKKAIIGTMLYAYMFPPLLLAIPLTSIFAALNLVDTLPRWVVAHFTMTLPLAVWFLWGFLKAMPFELEEAAMVDGCSRLGAFVRVILPLSLPGLATGGDLFLPAVLDRLHVWSRASVERWQQDPASRACFSARRSRHALGRGDGRRHPDRDSAVCPVRVLQPLFRRRNGFRWCKRLTSLP